MGILQSEADNIDEYICPRCQKNNSVNFANMKDLMQKDFDGLKKLIKQLQVDYVSTNQSKFLTEYRTLGSQGERENVQWRIKYIITV